jgi:hypothetical protein
MSFWKLFGVVYVTTVILGALLMGLVFWLSSRSNEISFLQNDTPGTIDYENAKPMPLPSANP